MFDPYPLKAGSRFPSFEFVTAHGIKYRIYFVYYGFLFPKHPIMEQCVFTFNIKLVEGDPRESGIDPRVADTIVEVLQGFFDEKWNAVIYTCDSSDSRQLARKRIFDKWFSKYNTGAFIQGKFITVFGKEEHYNSMILRADNPLWVDYLVAFDMLACAVGAESKPETSEAKQSG